MKTIFCTLLGILLLSAATAQVNKKQLDREAIKKMCGCYEVTFKYTETFAPEIDYEKKLDYSAAALEWAQLIVDQDDKLSIQHLLVVHDTTVIKHWRQDWLYENRNVFYYNKDNSWIFKEMEKSNIKGQWTQKVYQVDDSPRYSGSATWIHADGKTYWENKTDSPLPRREYTKRKDYNVMLRGNRQELTDYGWLHEQDNDKIIRKEGEEDVLLAQEKGYNTYKKIDDSRCKLAQDWWKENNKLWEKVRTVWTDVYNRKGSLTMQKAVDKQPLFMHFYSLDNSSSTDDIKSIIDKFIVN
ncbi:DUF6607 family protein [Aquimarina sp. MAR_2010_214]|uniref:DUF6607 family protein n=1 Tax=Aquimarina sp. MAR_2010_214 TaxID=1250026 RepID=UPI000C70E47F|nr:DUF6607 family protein [Aquimarina sp. MAR_2010_214]